MFNIKNIFTILSIVSLGFTAFQCHKKSNEVQRLHTELQNTKTEYKNITDKVALLENQYLSEKNLKEQLEKEWNKEKSYLKGRVKVLSDATYLVRERARKENNSDLIYSGDKIKYVFNEIRLDSGKGPPVGYVLIFENGKVVSKVYDFEINVKNAISRDEKSGKYTILAKGDYILKAPHLSKDINWLDKPYPLDIVKGKSFIDPTEVNLKLKKQFYWYAPNLSIGMQITPQLIKPSLGFSLLGYGRSQYDLDWKFLQINSSLNTNKTLDFGISPFLYRLFDPYLKNTYIGPTVEYNGLQFNYLIGIMVNL